jgi:hypothetical protein
MAAKKKAVRKAQPAPIHGMKANGKRPRKSPIQGGRPSLYTEEIADFVCNELAKGPSLKSICEKYAHLPESHTIRGWAARDHNGFGAKYAAARQLQMEAMEDELREVASKKTGDVNRDRLHVDTLKWAMAKTAPKKYGDRVVKEVVGDGGGPLKVDVTGMSDEKLGQLETLLSEITGGTDRPSQEGEGGEGEA